MRYSLILRKGSWVPSGTSDIVSETSAINEVQNAEKKAADSIVHAEEEKKNRILQAHEKARKIVDEAEAEARSIREGALKRGADQAAKETKKMMADAEKVVAKIRKAKPTASVINGVVIDMVKEIVGE